MSDAQSTDPQPKDIQELYRVISPLSDERRIEAKERARALVVKAAGEMPKREDFDQHTESKYPGWMNWTINILCFIVLVAAFLPSAFRLFYIGSTTFIQTLNDAHAAMVTGASIVIMAELSMVLFSIASVVIEAHKTSASQTPSRWWIVRQLTAIDSVRLLLIVSQLVATAIAIVGNAQVSLVDGHDKNLFAVIEAFSPSIVVFATAYILKAQMLSAIERRYANTRAFQIAQNAWKTATGQPENDSRYRPSLHNALRDFIREDNAKGAGATARREYMGSLVLQDWQRLVRRELQADEWYADPDASVVSVMPVSVQTTARQTIDNRQRVYAPVSSVPTTDRRHNGNGHMSYADSVSVQTDEDTQPTDTRQSGAGFTRVATAVEIARQWLADNPDKAQLPLRQLEELIGVGKDSIAKARKVMMEERG